MTRDEIKILEGLGMVATETECDGEKYVSFKFPKENLGSVIIKIAKLVAKIAVEIDKQSDPKQQELIEVRTQLAAMKGICNALDCLDNSLNKWGSSQK